MPDHRPHLVQPDHLAPPLAEPAGPIESLAGIASAQHGVFTRQQALDAGFATRTVERRVASGEWVRRGSGVLAHATAPITYRHGVMAAVLSFDGAAASHECAGTLLGFRYLGSHPVTVSVPPSSWHRLDRVEVHRYADLAPEWITQRHGIPITTPERTMIDLAAVVRDSRMETVLDAALGQRQVDLVTLLRAFNRLAHRGRRGIGRMRRLLDARGDGYVAPGSELERRYLRFTAGLGLPEPAKQLPTFWNDRLMGLADFAYPDQRVIVELDGRLGHTQLLDQDLDNVRDQRAVAARWSVIRITWRQLHERPDQVVEVLRSVLQTEAA